MDSATICLSMATFWPFVMPQRFIFCSMFNSFYKVQEFSILVSMLNSQVNSPHMGFYSCVKSFQAYFARRCSLCGYCFSVYLSKLIYIDKTFPIITSTAYLQIILDSADRFSVYVFICFGSMFLFMFVHTIFHCLPPPFHVCFS